MLTLDDILTEDLIVKEEYRKFKNITKSISPKKVQDLNIFKSRSFLVHHSLFFISPSLVSFFVSSFNLNKTVRLNFDLYEADEATKLNFYNAAKESLKQQEAHLNAFYSSLNDESKLKLELEG